MPAARRPEGTPIPSGRRPFARRSAHRPAARRRSGAHCQPRGPMRHNRSARRSLGVVEGARGFIVPPAMEAPRAPSPPSGQAERPATGAVPCNSQFAPAGLPQIPRPHDGKPAMFGVNTRPAHRSSSADRTSDGSYERPLTWRLSPCPRRGRLVWLRRPALYPLSYGLAVSCLRSAKTI